MTSSLNDLNRSQGLVLPFNHNSTNFLPLPPLCAIVLSLGCQELHIVSLPLPTLLFIILDLEASSYNANLPEFNPFNGSIVLRIKDQILCPRSDPVHLLLNQSILLSPFQMGQTPAPKNLCAQHTSMHIISSPSSPCLRHKERDDIPLHFPSTIFIKLLFLCQKTVFPH